MAYTLTLNHPRTHKTMRIATYASKRMAELNLQALKERWLNTDKIDFAVALKVIPTVQEF